MTKEKMQQEMKRLADERQDTFIKKLLIDVQWLEDKAIKAKYEPTQNERYIPFLSWNKCW